MRLREADACQNVSLATSLSMNQTIKEQKCWHRMRLQWRKYEECMKIVRGSYWKPTIARLDIIFYEHLSERPGINYIALNKCKVQLHSTFLIFIILCVFIYPHSRLPRTKIQAPHAPINIPFHSKFECWIPFRRWVSLKAIAAVNAILLSWKCLKLQRAIAKPEKRGVDMTRT